MPRLRNTVLLLTLCVGIDKARQAEELIQQAADAQRKTIEGSSD